MQGTDFRVKYPYQMRESFITTKFILNRDRSEGLVSDRGEWETNRVTGKWNFYKCIISEEVDQQET